MSTTKYLPFGKEIIPTKDEIENQIRIFKQYDYYGIPYGYFDSVGEGEQFMTQRDIDISSARILIMQGKQLPKDLEHRLLEYKHQQGENK